MITIDEKLEIFPRSNLWFSDTENEYFSEQSRFAPFGQNSFLQCRQWCKIQTWRSLKNEGNFWPLQKTFTKCSYWSRNDNRKNSIAGTRLSLLVPLHLERCLDRLHLFAWPMIILRTFSVSSWLVADMKICSVTSQSIDNRSATSVDISLCSLHISFLFPNRRMGTSSPGRCSLISLTIFRASSKDASLSRE